MCHNFKEAGNTCPPPDSPRGVDESMIAELIKECVLSLTRRSSSTKEAPPPDWKLRVNLRESELKKKRKKRSERNKNSHSPCDHNSFRSETDESRSHSNKAHDNASYYEKNSQGLIQIKQSSARATAIRPTTTTTTTTTTKTTTEKLPANEFHQKPGRRNANYTGERIFQYSQDAQDQHDCLPKKRKTSLKKGESDLKTYCVRYIYVSVYQKEPTSN